MKPMFRSALRRVLAAVVIPCAVSAGLAPAQAGEAIQFSKGRVTLTPEEKPTLAGQKAERSGRYVPMSPQEMISPWESPTRRRDPKAEREAKARKLEEKNWVFVDPGELQETDSDSRNFGLRDDSLEKKDEEPTLNIFERKQPKPGAERGRSGAPGPGGPNGEPAARPGAPNAEATDSSGSDKSSLVKSEKISESKIDLQTLLAPGRSSLAPAARSQTTLREFLGGGSEEKPTTRSREEVARRQESAAAPAGGPAPSAPVARPAVSYESLGMRNDFNARPAALSPARSTDGSSFRSPTPAFGGSANDLNRNLSGSPALPDPFSSRGNNSAFGAQGNSFQSPFDRRPEQPSLAPRNTFDRPERPR